MEILSLNELCSKCGYFENSQVNNGYGCSNEDNEDVEYINSKGEYFEGNEVRAIARSFTKRKIFCNRRLAKKFIKKARTLSDDDFKKRMSIIGYKAFGKCFSFSCPVAYEISFDGLKSIDVNNEYDYIENEQDMPCGFGEELMAMY